MKRFLLTLSALCALGTLSFAQNRINAEVEVSNDYRTRLADVEKYSVGMAVPDSLYKFNLDFDYAVFENPYKGAYEFSPYAIKLTPDKSVYDGHKLYVRAGAGWTMRPRVSAVWTPVATATDRLNVYQDLGGYFGTYYPNYDALDMYEKIGVNGQHNGAKATIGYGLGYDGMFVDGSQNNFYHTGNAHFSIKSTVNDKSYFYYDLNASYLFALDRYRDNVMENSLRIYGTLGPVIKRNFRIFVDLDAAGIMYSNNWKGAMVNVKATPRIAAKLGPVDVSAGIKLDYNLLGSSSEFKFFPDARLSLKIAKALEFYAVCTGDVETYDYDRLKRINRHIRYDITTYGQMVTFGTTDLDAYGGIKGGVFDHLQYDISGGWRKVSGVPMLDDGGYFFGTNYKTIHVDAKLSWKNDFLEAELDGHFNKVSDMVSSYLIYTKLLTFPITVSNVYALPQLTGEARVTYNWNRRLYVGVSALASTARTASNLSELPAYVNLGAYAEWKFAGRWSVWMSGDNLLGQNIYYVPLYSQKGPSVTAGVCFVL